MVSINSVYNTVKNLANKDQKGFITPAMFTSFARTAQIKIYNKIFDAVFEDKKLRRANMDHGRFLSKVFVDKNDLSEFMAKDTIFRTNGVYKKPDDFRSLISLTLRKPARRAIHIMYDEDKIQHVLASTLSAPTQEYPIALIGNEVEVFPSTIAQGVDMRYYRYPTPPQYNFFNALNELGEDIELFSDTSVDFELPAKYEEELVFEIAAMAGVNIKEPIVVNQSNRQIDG